MALLFGVGAVVAVAYRFRFATELTDETFSIAMPYRYVLGDRPFVDEISIQQTAGIILFPFVWLYVKLKGGTTGIVLFVRYIHLFVFKGATALAAYSMTKHWVRSRASAVLVAFVPFVFVPHSIPNVGYNVIGMTMLAAGAFCGATALSEPSARWRSRYWVMSGASLGLMSFAYPPLVASAFLFTLLVPFCAVGNRVRATALVIAGGAAVGLAVAPSLLFGGIAGLRRSLGWGIQASEHHDIERVKQALQMFWDNMPSCYGYLAIASIIAWLTRSIPLRVMVAIAYVPAVALSYRSDWAIVGTLRIVAYLGALAPFAVLVARPNAGLVRSTVLVLAPCFLGALVCVVASTQRLDAAALPFYAAVIVLTALCARAVEAASGSTSLALVPAASVLLFLVLRCFDTVYRDAPFAQLTELVTVGPFKGIRTTSDRAQMLHELSDIAARYDKAGGRFTVLYEAPGLYLASRMPPGAHCVWEESNGDLDGMLSYWKAHANGRGIVVRRRGWPGSRIDPQIGPADRVIYETRHFLVYREP